MDREIVGIQAMEEAAVDRENGTVGVGEDRAAPDVVAAGERWRGATGPLRPAYEDMLGAGAVISALGTRGASPEARAAAAVFDDARPDLRELVMGCGSGIELIDRGAEVDVELAAQLDVSSIVPTLDGAVLVDG